MARVVIKTENMSFHYPDGTSALRDINLEILEGERAAIIGSNGAGKSTLFSHFNGILRPTTGQIMINGEAASYKKEGLIKIRQTVGMVFQNPDDQLFSPTVEEDVAFGPMNLGLPDEEVEKRVEESLEAVGMNGSEKSTPSSERRSKEESSYCRYSGHETRYNGSGRTNHRPGSTRSGTGYEYSL